MLLYISKICDTKYVVEVTLDINKITVLGIDESDHHVTIATGFILTNYIF